MLTHFDALPFLAPALLMWQRAIAIKEKAIFLRLLWLWMGFAVAFRAIFDSYPAPLSRDVVIAVVTGVISVLLIASYMRNECNLQAQYRARLQMLWLPLALLFSRAKVSGK